MTEKTQNSSLFYQKYHIQTQIGRGASGVCYKVKRISDGKYFALKKISSHSLKKNNIKGAYNEVKILSSLQHQSIIQYVESFMDDQQLYIVMQYAQNGDLHTILKKRKLKQHYFEQHQLWAMMKQLLQGLQYLHSKNIIHRDVKTLNILVDANNNLLIGDLGVSKILKSDLGLFSRVGTPLYLPPEIIKYEKYDFKADIWGLGCVSYILATLNPPFQGQNIISLGQNIVNKSPKPIQRYSQNLQGLILQMLQKNHQKRASASILLKKYFIDNQNPLKSSKFLKQKKPIQNCLIEAKNNEQDRDSRQNQKAFRRYLTYKKIQTPEENYVPKNSIEKKGVHNLRNQKKFRTMIGNFVNDVIVKKQKKQQLVPASSYRATLENTIVIKPNKILKDQEQFKNNNQELTKYKKQTIKKAAISFQNIKVKQDLPANSFFQKANDVQTDRSSSPKKITFQKMKQNNLVQSAQIFITPKDKQQKIFPDKKNNISIRKLTTQPKYTAQTQNLRNKQSSNSEFKVSQQFIRSSKPQFEKVQSNELFNDIFRISNETAFNSQKKQSSGLGKFRQRPKSSIGKKQRYFQSSVVKNKRKQNLYSNFYSIIQTKVLKKPEVIIL